MLILFGPPPCHCSAAPGGCHGAIKIAEKELRKSPLQSARDVVAASRTTEAALAAFAHDIRTSLTGILALGELLASSNLGERERRWAAGIKTSAEHLAALTTLAIDAAKIDPTKADAGALTLQQQAFRPRRLVEALSDTLSARAETKGLTVEVKSTPTCPKCCIGDAARLRAAIENLIDNAVKFTERGAVRLDVRASRATRGRVKLFFTVTDSGIGLTRAEIKRLFRPFTQANAEIARRYGGSGLGLAVVKSLAKLMGGDLTVTSTPGRGASFRLAIVLPIAAADASGDAHAHRPRCRRAVSRFYAPRTTLTAASSSTPSSPNSAIAPTLSGAARRRSKRSSAATTWC